MNTARILFLKALRRVLQDMPERIWNFDKEMLGCDQDDRLDPLPHDGDSDNDMGPDDQ